MRFRATFYRKFTYKDPERTEKAFFLTGQGERGYHTRDLVYRRDGYYYYVGRADNMVKVSGYRVEMEEVERCLDQLPEVSACAVAPAMSDGHCVMLVAYVVPESGVKKGLAATAAIKKRLGGMMPSYMVPQKLVYLEELPKNDSGKIDRRLLREMAAVKRGEYL